MPWRDSATDRPQRRARYPLRDCEHCRGRTGMVAIAGSGAWRGVAPLARLPPGKRRKSEPYAPERHRGQHETPFPIGDGRHPPVGTSGQRVLLAGLRGFLVRPGAACVPRPLCRRAGLPQQPVRRPQYRPRGGIHEPHHPAARRPGGTAGTGAGPCSRIAVPPERPLPPVRRVAEGRAVVQRPHRSGHRGRATPRGPDGG